MNLQFGVMPKFLFVGESFWGSCPGEGILKTLIKKEIKPDEEAERTSSELLR